MKNYIILINLFFVLALHAQENQFTFLLKPIDISGLAGVQSYGLGQYEGNWFIFGGRLDGLHQRQPFASFDIAGHNNQIIMIDPKSHQVWKRSVNELPVSIREPMTSTNMQFLQEGESLILIGGYGYSPTIGDHTTYKTITMVHLPTLYIALQNNAPISDAFRQISDDKFQVTGGYLGKINDHYFLVGGQKFLGRYNPMGPTHGPGFLQEYTDAIKKFKVQTTGNSFQISDFVEWKDTDLLHRRDYNMAAQILPDGSQGLTAFSGVFKHDVDLPFLNCVQIRENGFELQADFQQLLNHYHCAHLTAYDNIHKEMYTVFFGGIAQYYEENGILVKDDNVPFVKTIATVWRDVNGQMKEKKLPVEMPVLLGSGAEFIPMTSNKTYANGVLKYHELSSDTTQVGYIFGGIASTGKNIFFINDGTQSSASSVFFEVSLVKVKSTSVLEYEVPKNLLMLEVFPNPASDEIQISFTLDKMMDIELTLADDSAKIFCSEKWPKMPKGAHSITKNISLMSSGVIHVILSNGPSKYTQKVVKL
ncbi:MAG: T9SS C-terminal target domain-containing protein [Saprospiraceae bacterium]